MQRKEGHAASWSSAAAHDTTVRVPQPAPQRSRSSFNEHVGHGRCHALSCLSIASMQPTEGVASCPTCPCSLSRSSPGESSGRGRSNFLQRLSSSLRDRSNRGYRNEELSGSSPGAQPPAQGAVQGGAAPPMRVNRIKVLKEDSLGGLLPPTSSTLPHIEEGGVNIARGCPLLLRHEQIRCASAVAGCSCLLADMPAGHCCPADIPTSHVREHNTCVWLCLLRSVLFMILCLL